MRYRKPLRVAVLTYSTQPRGGVVHACALAEALTDLGHDAVLFAVDDADRDFERPPRCAYRLVGVRSQRESTVSFVRRRIAAYVEYFASERAFDIYHAQDGISGNALATLVARGSIPSFVRTVHHLDDFADPELAALHDRSIVAAAQHFTVSHVWRERLRERYGVRARVVPNGVDLARFSPVTAERRRELRAELGFGAAPVFLTIGGIEPRKNTLVLLEAFALVRAVQPLARLIVAGGASVFEHGAYRQAFEARRSELGLTGDEITIAGVRPDAEIVSLLRAADAFVFPSLVEGFGLAVLEALACGTPVIASALAPFTEYLTSRTALLADPHEPASIAAAMLRGLRPRVRRRLSAGGSRVASVFSWRASARAHLAGYSPDYETAV